MELRAAIAGLEKAKELGYSEGITLFSDSQYVLGLANGIYSAQKNVLLAIHLRKLALELGISTQWVKGHSGNPWNDRCDSLAKRGKEENAKSSQRASSAEGQQQQASVGSGNQ
jgi:ribonuclease HI